jgi:hypothetical protein
LPRRLAAIPHPCVADVVARLALVFAVVRAAVVVRTTAVVVPAVGAERAVEGADVGTGVRDSPWDVGADDVLRDRDGAGAEATVGTARGVAQPAPTTSTSAAA